MSGKTTSMSKIKQMLLLLQASKGVKTIASITGISRNTIKSYKVRLEKMDASIDDLLLLDNPVLESVFHAGNPAYSDKRFDTLKLLFDDYIKEQLWEKSVKILRYIGRKVYIDNIISGDNHLIVS